MERDDRIEAGGPPTRLGAARERAFTAKLALFSGAAASFGIAMVLVKASPPATGAAGSDGTVPSGSVVPASVSEDDETVEAFSPGLIGPPTASPSFSTRSS